MAFAHAAVSGCEAPVEHEVVDAQAEEETKIRDVEPCEVDWRIVSPRSTGAADL
jgi:hypothetical protein